MRDSNILSSASLELADSLDLFAPGSLCWHFSEASNFPAVYLPTCFDFDRQLTVDASTLEHFGSHAISWSAIAVLEGWKYAHSI